MRRAAACVGSTASDVAALTSAAAGSGCSEHKPRHRISECRLADAFRAYEQKGVRRLGASIGGKQQTLGFSVSEQ